ncbi:MAG: ATP-binding cassette domain-containing protein [Deferrisomatales bacterium]
MDPPQKRAPPAVYVRAARLSYHDQVLFDRLDFALPAGRWTCLLGPSGVGKTSLLRLIAGLAPAAAGSSVVCDDGGPVEGRATYMAQQDLLLPWLSAVDNVLLGHRLRGEDGRRDRRERARSLLEQVGLGGHLDARPATLSGGMRQRVALARTLMEDRPLVLMDEPFSALDVITKVSLQGLFAEHLRGRTVLLVTHDPLEALRLGHLVYVMAGRPARLGPPLEPAGEPPRDLHDGALLSLQADLLERLSAAAQEGVA